MLPFYHNIKRNSNKHVPEVVKEIFFYLGHCTCYRYHDWN